MADSVKFPEAMRLHMISSMRDHQNLRVTYRSERTPHQDRSHGTLPQRVL
jgi:hypothetical protein